MGVDATDFTRLSETLTLDTARVGARAATLLRATATRVERDQKALAAVDTGNMRASVHTTYGGDGRSAAMSAEIGPSAEYAPYVEFGTSRMAPQPFVFPSLDRHAGTFIAGLEQIVEVTP